MKSIVFLNVAFALMIPCMTACSGCSETEHSEEVTAEIIAAQMEGRNTARNFVNREWKDSSKLEKHLIEVKTRQDKYVTDGKPECAAAFDSAFISTVRAVRPDLARAIQRKL